MQLCFPDTSREGIIWLVPCQLADSWQRSQALACQNEIIPSSYAE